MYAENWIEKKDDLTEKARLKLILLCVFWIGTHLTHIRNMRNIVQHLVYSAYIQLLRKLILILLCHIPCIMSVV